MGADDWQALEAIAIQAARVGGDTALRWFQTSDVQVELKADESPVTQADQAAEKAMRDYLSQERPGDGWLGEETGTAEGSTGCVWIVDPIDGTKNFIHGVPLWATLVACEYQGEIVASAVAIPGLNEMYHAAKGHGAYWNTKAHAGF